MARSSGAVRFQVVGLDDFQRDLLRFAASLEDMTPAWRKVGDLLRDRSRAAAPGSIGSAIQKRVTPQSASVQVIHRPPRAVGVVMGANRRFGWYAAPQFQYSTGRQFEKWVGNQWQPGMSEGKPYFIGDAINESIDDALDLLADEIMHKARFAFPKVGGVSMAP